VAFGGKRTQPHAPKIDRSKSEFVTPLASAEAKLIPQIEIDLDARFLKE
jgi:hypothetical protein